MVVIKQNWIYPSSSKNCVLSIVTLIGITVTESNNFYCESRKWHPDINKNIKVFEISGPSFNGLYVVPKALNFATQLKIAKISVQEYSAAEHTNLTNLRRLEEESKGMLSSDSNIVEYPSKEVDTLWHRSIEENDMFRSFFKLRWSSLGYHYGNYVESNVLNSWKYCLITTRLDREKISKESKVLISQWFVKSLQKYCFDSS